MHFGSLSGDVEWYRQKAVDSGGAVLELGAGTGRVTIPIAQAGIQITAMDLHAGMLDKLRRKVGDLPSDVQRRVTVQHGDMRSFALDVQFHLVIIPFRAFLHNLTRDDQLATLRRVHAHLQPGGGLALNVFHPSLEFMAANAGAYAGVLRAREVQQLDNGAFAVFSDSSRYDTVQQRVHSLIRTEEFSADGSLVRTHMMNLELAYLYPSDIKSLLAESGFDLIRISGDFHGRPFQNDRDELVVEARRR